MFCCWLKSMYLFWHSCSSFVRTPQPGEFCVRQSLGRAPTVAYLKLSMQNMNRTFTFGTLKALHNFISTVQEENACLITLPVNKYNLFCDFCFFFSAKSVLDVCTHSSPLHFTAMSLSLQINLLQPLLPGETKAEFLILTHQCLSCRLLFVPMLNSRGLRVFKP